MSWLILNAEAGAMPLADNSVDAVVTDPPYALTSQDKRDPRRASPAVKQREKIGGFMGMRWDGALPGVEVWAEALRVLKPGGYLLAFGGTRTYHRLTCAIEDAGFEIRDCMMWIFGSGFPKSLDVSKQLDAQEARRWLNVSKRIDNLAQSDILSEWKERSLVASNAEVLFAKSETETGTNTLKNGSVVGGVRLSVKCDKSNAGAILAELNSAEVQRSSEESDNTVLVPVVGRELLSRAKLADVLQRSDQVKSTRTFTVLCDVKDWRSENVEPIARAAEALLTWLGDEPSSKRLDTDALTVRLADALKLTILSRSKTFQNLDTMSRTDFASAITVTITESTAASLISFMVDTARSKAIDKAAGAERKVTGVKPGHEDFAGRGNKSSVQSLKDFGSGGFSRPWMDDPEKIEKYHMQTEAATDAAKEWQGWGTALKPAWEPIIVARKPLEGTVAENVQKYGTGAINIDACRIAYQANEGRFPANIVFSHHPDCEQIGFKTVNGNGHYPRQRGQGGLGTSGHSGQAGLEELALKNEIVDDWRCHPDCPVRMLDEQSGELTSGDILPTHGDTGGASRFFYTAKADRTDRGGSTHPTVKPQDLMQYLIKLVARPDAVILDPFVGSGTTVLVADKMGYTAVGLDNDRQYPWQARQRIIDDAPLLHLE